MMFGISWQLWLFIGGLTLALVCTGIGAWKSEALRPYIVRGVQWLLRPLLRRILRVSE